MMVLRGHRGRFVLGDLIAGLMVCGGFCPLSVSEIPSRSTVKPNRIAPKPQAKPNDNADATALLGEWARSWA